MSELKGFKITFINDDGSIHDELSYLNSASSNWPNPTLTILEGIVSVVGDEKDVADETEEQFTERLESLLHQKVTVKKVATKKRPS